MINLEPISKTIQERMFEKMRALGKTSGVAPNESSGDRLTTDQIMARTTFLRMTSGQTNAVILMGGKLKDDLQSTSGYNDIYGPRTYKTGGQKATAFETFDIDETGEPTGFETEYYGGIESNSTVFSNNSKRPMPGIKSAEISFRGGTKATRQATISWTCWSYEELDILMPHFLTHGKTVMVEWGWIYNKGSLPELPFLVTDDVGNRFISSDAFTNVKNDVIDGNGDFDMMIGVVKNFEYTTREDGAFDCTTEIMSIGINLFENPTPNESVLDPGITYNLSDTELKDLPSLEEKLKEAIDSVDKGSSKVLDLNTNVTLKLFVNNIDGYLRNYWTKSSPAQRGEQSGINYVPNKFIYKFDLQSEGTFNPYTGGNIGGAGGTDISEYWVRWGWFEDNVLSKFLSITSRETGQIITQFRSIENKLEKGGGGRVTGNYESTRIRNHERLETINLNNYILPGQLYPQDKIPAPELGEGLDGDSNLIKSIAKIVNSPNNFEPFATKTDIIEKSSDLGEDWQTESGGLTAKANTRLYAKDPSMKGKAKEVRAARYKELFGGSESTEVAKPENQGYFRNMLINTKSIKRAFGVIDGFTAESISTFEALRQLFRILNEDLNIWSFDITIDENEDYRAKIIDNDMTAFDFTKETVEQKSMVNANGEVGTSDKPGEAGVFFFPVWRHDSIVKRQNIVAKVPNAMQLATMYGSNLDQLKEFSNPGSSFGEEAGVLVGGLGADDVDASKSGLDIAYRNQNTRNIGSSNGFASDKFGTDDGEDIISYMNSVNLKGTGKIIEKAKDQRQEINEKLGANVEQQKILDEEFNAAIPPPLLNHLNDDILLTLLLREDELNYEGKDFHTLYSSKFDKNMKMRPHFIKSVNYYTTNHGKYKDANTSSIIPLEIELDIDGIGGIYPGNSFHSSYLPKRYQKKTIFQMFEVNHRVDSGGWTVSLTGKMRATKSSLFDRYKRFGELLQEQLEQYIKPGPVVPGDGAYSPTTSSPGDSYEIAIPGATPPEEKTFDPDAEQTLNMDIIGGRSQNLSNMTLQSLTINTTATDKTAATLIAKPTKKKKKSFFQRIWGK